MEEEIKAEFERSGFTLEDDEQILKKCLTFCISYKLEPADLVSSWELYYLNRQLDQSIVQDSEMDGFLLHLQNEQKEAVTKEEANLHVYLSKDVEMLLSDDEDEAKEMGVGTPLDKSLNHHLESVDATLTSYGKRFSSGKPSQLVTPFGRRKDKFVIKFSVNDMPDTATGCNGNDHGNHEDDIIRRIPPLKKCSLVVPKPRPEPGCRFMYDSIEDRLTALDSRIRKHKAAFVASGLYEEPMDATAASQRNVFSVGMICCDGEGRLNDKSVKLQSSTEHSGGHIRLDLHKLEQFSIFPGQIVGIKGQNPSGHCLIATEMIDSVPLSATTNVDIHPAKKQALDNENQSIELSLQDEISVLIASGPFTTTDNLWFEPLTELLAYARRKPPQLLVLLGPFVDSDHPEIKKGNIDRTFDEIFNTEVLTRVQDYVEAMGSEAQVILVPSMRDANHDLVFPQPPFNFDNPRITCLTNPGTFEANKVKVGCSTVDILKHLSREEMSRNPAKGVPSDRMSRLATHILNQHSFYPLYPQAEDVPLDFSLAPEALHLESVPDILILPSDMKFFIKVLSPGGTGADEEQKKCMCVNPGRLAKGEGAGTFAELNCHTGSKQLHASIIAI